MLTISIVDFTFGPSDFCTRSVDYFLKTLKFTHKLKRVADWPTGYLTWGG